TTRRFSSTVRLPKMRRPWGTRPTPSRAIFCGGRPTSERPPSRMSPPTIDGGVSPQSARTSVVLPMPLRPSSAIALPSSTESVTPSSTWAVAYETLRSVTSSTSFPPTEVDGLDGRVGPDLLGGAVGERDAVVEAQHAIDELERERHVVLDEQERDVA